MFCHTLLAEASFFSALLEIDEDLAREARAAGCPCGGRLHAAHYKRRPRGGPVDVEPACAVRLSFCCDRDGCRRRTTPASVRFLERRVYYAAVVVLVSIWVHGLTDRRIAALRQHLGATFTRRTVARWRQWWRQRFLATRAWGAIRGRLLPPVDVTQLPASLVERFGQHEERDRLVAALRLLAPISATPSSAREV